MPIKKTPDFSPNVAAKALQQHGLEGKVTPKQLAEVAKKYDDKNVGYISGDEFAKAAVDLKATLGGDADVGDSPPAGQTHSPLFARQAVIGGAAQADMADPQLKMAKERILANVGAGSRFGQLDAGEGLRAFTIDDGTIAKIPGDDIEDKHKAAGNGALFGVLTTGDEPHLTIGSAQSDGVRVLAKFDLMDDDAAKNLGGTGDGLQAAAALFGGAPAIELGGEDKSWSLGSSDWSTGDGFKGRQEIKTQKNAAREAARKARADAAAVAMAGPTTIEAFDAAGVKGHTHTTAEKAALLDLVTKGAGEDATFPNPDDSYYGLHAFVLEGSAAAHAVAFAQANRGGPVDFDPDKHSVILTAKSFDEAQVGTFVVDRATQKVIFGDESNAVDYDGDAVEKFFPKADMDDDYAAHVIGTLTGRGDLLGVVAGEDTPDDMDFSDWA
jgi:hypothetical protein